MSDKIRDDDPKLRSLFHPDEVYRALGTVHPTTGKSTPVVRNLEPGERVLTCVEAQILYSAFQYDTDLDDDLPKKASIKKRFLPGMEPQMATKTDRESGTVVEIPLPGFPRRNFRFRDPSVLCFTPEQATYLVVKLKALIKAKDQQGKPILTADAADAVVDLLGDDVTIKGILHEWIEDSRDLHTEHVKDAKVEALVG